MSTTINEKEKNMLRVLLSHPLAGQILSGFEKEVETLTTKINKKRIDKKVKIEPFILKHFTFKMVNENGSILVTSSIPPDPKRNYSCSVSYEDKESYLAFLKYLLQMNEFYGNPLTSYQRTYGDEFNVCEADWVERTYSINSTTMRFDSTSIYDEVGVWTRIRPSRLTEMIAMIIPRLFLDYPEEIASCGEDVEKLYTMWRTMDKSRENKVMLVKSIAKE